MEVPVDEVTVLPGGDATLAVDADAARVANHLAHHVLGRVILEAEPLRELVVLAADWPLGDVVGPLVRRYRGRRVAVLWIEAAHAARDAPTGPGLARGPLLPRGDRLL